MGGMAIVDLQSDAHGKQGALGHEAGDFPLAIILH
jgi:hypothetical protein